MIETKAFEQLNWLKRANLFFGIVGFLLLHQASTPAACKSFGVGWLISVVNLELLSRLGLMLASFFKDEKLSPLFYGLLVVKFSFWGLVIALFSLTGWIQGVPFVLGNATLIVAAFGLGVKELLYARA